MKNIQILVTLKAQVETADFMMEDLATCIDVEDVDCALPAKIDTK